MERMFEMKLTFAVDARNGKKQGMHVMQTNCRAILIINKFLCYMGS